MADGDSARARLRQAVDAADRDGRAILLPGVYDALSARLAQDAGYEAIYVTGAGLANSRLGVPDIGLVGFDTLLDHVTALSDVVDVPLVVDADTGFGNAVTRHPHRASAGAGRGGGDPARGPGVPQALRPLRGEGVRLQRGDGEQDPRRRRQPPRPEPADRGTHRRPRHGGARRGHRAGAGVQGRGRRRDLRRGPHQRGGAARGGPARARPEAGEHGGGRRHADTQPPPSWGSWASRSRCSRTRRCARPRRRSAPRSRSCCARARPAGLLDRMATWQERQEAVGKSEYDELERRYSS